MASTEPFETATAPQKTSNSLSPHPSNDSLKPINLGTRRSILARVQTDIVARSLKKAFPDRKYEIHAMSTLGDKDQQTALHEFNAKALWTTELEAGLEAGELDMIVHSLKDMPTQLPPNLSLGAILAREDPRDALVVHPSLASTHKTLASLPAGSVIGTSSLRRSSQLKRHYPHLEFADARGNVGTRLSKLDAPDSHFAALILAAAGLLRLGLENRITAYLDSSNGGILHAVGQGAIGVEIRGDDEVAKEMLAAVGCEFTTRATLAERSLMRTLEGGCSVPIGVETHWVKKKNVLGSNSGGGVGVGVRPAASYDKLTGVAVAASEAVGAEEEDEEEERSDELVMKAIVVSLDGKKAVEAEIRRKVTSRQEADELGWDVAKKLVEGGADKILEEINLNRNIIAQQGDA